jgi:hypothetical protein
MYEIKFGYVSGYSLIFAAFQPSGAGRGIANQPLPEIRPTGFYIATPITDLEVGDVVLVYNLETLYWEDDPLYIETEDFLTYEGERLHWEGEWLMWPDDTISDVLTWVGDPLGAGEYESPIDFAADLTGLEAKVDVVDENVDLLIVEAQRVNNVYDETIVPTTVTVIKNL